MISYTFSCLGKINSQKQNEAEPRPQTCSSFEYPENTITSEQLPDWRGEDPTAETQVRGRLTGGGHSPPVAPDGKK